MDHPDQDNGGNHVIKGRFKLCPRCGYFVVRAVKGTFCILCGTAMIDECPQCREAILYPETTFCPMCGTRLTDARS